MVQESKDEVELDSVLAMVQNPVRRDIIKRLSREPSYPLQLSKELGLGQQLIAKHLNALEKMGFVTSSMEQSPSGPDRREYSLKKNVSLVVDFAPHLFVSHLIALDLDHLSEDDIPKNIESLVERIEKITDTSSASEGRINAIGKIIGDVDKKIQQLEEERALLLYIRTLAMSKASKIMHNSENSTDSRRVLYQVLDSGSKNVQEISESVNLREESVRGILRDLKI